MIEGSQACARPLPYFRAHILGSLTPFFNGVQMVLSCTGLPISFFIFPDGAVWYLLAVDGVHTISYFQGWFSSSSSLVCGCFLVYCSFLIIASPFDMLFCWVLYLFHLRKYKQKKKSIRKRLPWQSGHSIRMGIWGLAIESKPWHLQAIFNTGWPKYFQLHCALNDFIFRAHFKRI